MSEYIEEKEWLEANVPTHLALTGRIKSWLAEPEGRLPVSCTVFRVKDSMEGKDGIEDSWSFTSHALRNAAGVALDLSELRPKGHDNGRGLIASGVVSFAKFYSLINQELRRGGTFRNGAVTLHLDFDHDDILHYLKASTEELPWCKRSVYVSRETWNSSTPLKRAMLAKYVNNGTVFLAKPQHSNDGTRLYSNVCMEVLLPHRGSCLLSAVNMGSLADSSHTEIVDAFVNSMNWLCRLQDIGIRGDDYYLSPTEDKQVGLGIIGLANYLAINNFTYEQLAYSFTNNNEDFLPIKVLSNALQVSSLVADYYDMERAFAIAPTASMAYQYKDCEGYTCSPEISPPLDHTVYRNSDIRGLEKYVHNPSTQTTQNVSWETQWQVLCGMQKLMNQTGKTHAISANIWNTCLVDEEWIESWLDSPLLTTYYRLDDKTQHALDKTQVVQRRDCESCGG